MPDGNKTNLNALLGKYFDLSKYPDFFTGPGRSTTT